MPLRFGAVGPSCTREVLQFKPDLPKFVVGGSDRSFERETPLHWLPGPRKAVPCTWEDCPWCLVRPPDRVCTYVPCMAWSENYKKWKEWILPIHQRMADWLPMPRQNVVYQFGRVKHHNAPVQWKHREDLKIAAVFPGFELLPSLLKMWGMYGEAKRVSLEPTADTLKLFEESTSDRAAAL